MKLEHAQAIVNAASDAGLDVRLYEGYSGRGMYGKTTAGVVGSLRDILACTAQAAINQDHDGKGDDLVCALATTSSDSMGRDLIVY